MKNLVQWDPKQYINIWYVKEIRSEILPKFSCGKWSRQHEGGYAIYAIRPRQSGWNCYYGIWTINGS